MKSYYSNKVTVFLQIVYALFIPIIFFVWIGFYQIGCGHYTTIYECAVMFDLNVYYGLIPFLYIVLSSLIIFIQQKGFRKIGYLMLPLLAFSPFFLKYTINHETWFNVNDFIYFVNIEDISRGLVGSFIFNSIILTMLILVSLIPFYVLGKLIKEDLFKKIVKR